MYVRRAWSDGHQAILLRSAHKLAGAAGHSVVAVGGPGLVLTVTNSLTLISAAGHSSLFRRSSSHRSAVDLVFKEHATMKTEVP
jgi:hypothetical protein